MKDGGVCGDVKKATTTLGSGPRLLPSMRFGADNITEVNLLLWFTRAIGAFACRNVLWICSSSNVEYVHGVGDEFIGRAELPALFTAEKIIILARIIAISFAMDIQPVTLR